MSDTIKAEKLDSTFKYKISTIPGGESIKSCFSCGVCTAACPVNKVYQDFNPRQIIRMTLLGDKKEVLSSDLIWYCILCERCYANCPQKVNFAHIVRALRDSAIKEGYVDKNLPENIDSIDNKTAEFRKQVIDQLLKNKKKLGNVDTSKIMKEVSSKL